MKLSAPTLHFLLFFAILAAASTPILDAVTAAPARRIVQQPVVQGCAHTVDVPREQFHINEAALRG